jgi:hypothetical protein
MATAQFSQAGSSRGTARQSSGNSSLSMIPFLDQAQSAARQFALDYVQRTEVESGFELAVAGVKVWRRVIVEIHSD